MPAKYSRNPIISGDINGGPYETGITTSANNRNHEVVSVNSSTQYAIVNVSVYNTTGGAAIVSVGTSQFTGSSANSRSVIYESIPATSGITRTIYVPPNCGLYWGSPTNGVQINVTGVRFVNG